ncbi:MAG: hypothetical protein U0996_26810 [Planctomycetaceae bacterium]
MSRFQTLLDELRTGADAALAWGDGTTLTFAQRWPWQAASCEKADELFQYQRQSPRRMLCLPDITTTPPELWCRRLAIVSSRLSRRLDLEQRWFDLFRTSILHAVEEKHSVVVVRGTASAEVTFRAAVLFGLPIVACEFWPDADSGKVPSPDEWLESCHERIRKEPRSEQFGVPVFRIWISPELPSTDFGEQTANEECSPFEPDRIAFQLATRVVVLSCRKGGNIQRAIRQHLESQHHRIVPIIVAAEASNALLPEFGIPDGWVPWIVEQGITSGLPNRVALKRKHRMPEEQEQEEEQHREEEGRTSNDPLSHPDEWLCHWTRAAQGPWPDETRDDFLDQLILGCASADRSALAAILNIIATKKLRASSLGIRGSYSVVSLTEVPLHEFRQRRVFRKHRHRFDFEPFGIAIRKERLKLLRARPVVYGNDQDWAALDDEARPYYQKATRDSSTSNLDEQEWRVHGDVPLEDLAPDDVVVFTDLPEQQALLRQCTTWKVILVPTHPDESQHESRENGRQC